MTLDEVSVKGVPENDFTPTEVLEHLRKNPEEVTPLVNHDDPIYLDWGFPVYRTAYGGSTDQQWEILLDRIQSQVAGELGHYQSGEYVKGPGTASAAEKLLSLFKLDARSDANLLGDADFDHIRQIYNDGTGGMPAKHRFQRYRLFLVADAEVMAAVARGDFWIKCVDPRYRPEDYISKNPRVGLGLYFLGYMWMTVESLTALWDLLDDRELFLLAPRLVNERLTEVWNGS